MKNIIKNLIRLLINPIIIEHTEKLQKEINTIYSEIHPQIFTSKTYRLGISKNPRKNFNSFDFCNLFRGDENFIKERHRFYLRFFSGRKNILDIGCGRGEFLELLKDSQIRSLGIDIDSEMVKFCKKKRLNVFKANFKDYLSKCADNSFGGIFACQLIEHISFEDLNLFFELCFRKLEKDGIVILETINPHCFPALKLFYMDPTHVQPLFPELTMFLLSSKGFNNLKLYYVHSVDTQDINIKQRREILQFKCADYAVIGIKR